MHAGHRRSCLEALVPEGLGLWGASGPGGGGLCLTGVPVPAAQRSAQELPLVEKQSAASCPVLGGKRMVLSGHNFLQDSKVIFVEKAPGTFLANGHRGVSCLGRCGEGPGGRGGGPACRSSRAGHGPVGSRLATHVCAHAGLISEVAGGHFTGHFLSPREVCGPVSRPGRACPV